jgi:hypothetical protein
MKKSSYILTFVMFLSIMFAIAPPVVPQIGTYQFHGAAGNVKTLKVRTADNDSLGIVFGPTYVTVLEAAFGAGALQVGAQKKSLVTKVINPYTLDFRLLGYGIHDAALYNTSNWGWTLGSFSANPDTIGDVVVSLYDPTNVTLLANDIYGTDVTVQNMALYLAQLPTSVAQYLGAITWEAKWENVGNTVVHHAVSGDMGILPVSPYIFFYYYNCTETWTYDGTYGSWIGYKVQANSTTVYEFTVELPATAAIPGYELPLVLGITGFSTIGLIFLVMKKRNK